jgi:SAM-dependent methyltransferase
LPDDSVDLVLFALALEYVDDRTATLRELRRVLRPGAIALSRQHPTRDWLRHGGSYFNVRVIEEVWSLGWPSEPFRTGDIGEGRNVQRNKFSRLLLLLCGP